MSEQLSPIGQFVVNTMEALLTFFAVPVPVIAAFAGGLMMYGASSSSLFPEAGGVAWLVGAVVGFCVGVLIDIVWFGFLFLLLDIRKTLRRIEVNLKV